MLAFDLVLGLHCLLQLSSSGLTIVLVPWCGCAYSVLHMIRATPRNQHKTQSHMQWTATKAARCGAGVIVSDQAPSPYTHTEEAATILTGRL